ncbi:hypothetical protein KW786_02055 [Candidatus Parcubacteria bacterium]|nr:hypothetical protein [Candidatus Parcubacteria bacterium]
MKYFKNLFLISLLAIGLGFYGVASAATYHVYGMGFTNATVSGNLGNYITGDTFIPRSDGSDCTCTGLYHVNFGYYPAHDQPSADFVSGFSEVFGGRCGQNVHLNTELSGKSAGYYMLAHPCGYSGYNSGTPSYCVINWSGTTADLSNCPNQSATIFVTVPTNGATTTDPTVNLTGSWVATNPALYHSIRLYWKYSANGVDTISTAKIIPITTNSGTFSVPLSYFDFDYNGDWVLTAVSDLKAPQLSDFIQTANIIDPVGYHLNINFSALTTPFTFDDWSTWYSTNSAGGYSEPSDFGNDFTGFFRPIFENAFRFANQVLGYFNADQAQAKGQQLGSVFPIADAYVKKIDLFFGGFPLSAFFQFAVIVMLAIFVIRTIFKFIPFFG